MLASILGKKKKRRLFWKNSWDSLTQNEKLKLKVTSLRITILFFPVHRNLREQNTTATRFPPAACSRLQSDSGDGTKREKKKRKKNKKTPHAIN